MRDHALNLARIVRENRGDFFWIALGQSLTLLAALLSLKLLTNFLAPDEYGYFVLGLAIMGMTQQFSFGPIAQVVLRFQPICAQQGAGAVFRVTVKRLHRHTGLAILALTLTVAWIMSKSSAEWPRLLILTALAAIASGLNMSLLNILMAQGKHTRMVRRQLAEAWLRLLAALMAIWIFQPSAQAVMGGYASASILVALITWRGLLAPISGEEPAISQIKSTEKQMFVYAYPFILFGLLGSASLYGDRWIVQHCCGLAGVGIYAAIYQLANAPVMVLANVTNQLLLPIVFNHGNAELEREKAAGGHALALATLLLAGLFAVLAGVAFVFGKSLLTLLTAPAIAAHYRLLWPILAALALFHLAQLQAAKGFRLLRPGDYIVPKILHAAILLAFGGYLSEAWGMGGMTLALGISSAVYLLAMLYANSKIEAIPRH